MKSLSKLRACQRGSLTVEAALLIPCMLLILCVGGVLADHLLAQQRVHRVTAAMADVLANQPLPKNVGLPAQLSLTVEPSLDLLAGMLSDPQTGEAPEHFGLRISYLDSTALPADGSPPPVTTWEGGSMDCPEHKPLVQHFRTLITPRNVGRSEFVQVDVCMDHNMLLDLPDWLIPVQLESRFVAMRRYWRGA